MSRALSGFFACNVAVATASIADLTSEKNRSKNMGLIGAAFGAGFTAGPVLGFSLMLLGERLGAGPPFGVNFSALGASFLSLSNAFVSFLFLKESLKGGRRPFSLFLKKGLSLKKILAAAFQKKRESFFRPPLPFPHCGVFKSAETGTCSSHVFFSLAGPGANRAGSHSFGPG